MITVGELALELIESILETASRVGQAYTRYWGKTSLPWYDHRFDWARGPANWKWMERGILGHFWMDQGDRVLDLCCGDGMFAGVYFGGKASIVQGLDRDQAAIDLATRLYGREGVEFFKIDILSDPFPLEKYDAVMWFQGIEHFDRDDCTVLLEKIKQHLHLNGFLFGSTVLGHASGNFEHKLEFLVPQDLRELLELHFNEVNVRTSQFGEARIDLFFHCR